MRGSWNWQRVVAIAIGAALGAALRWAVLTTVDGGAFPWPVLVVNVAGSLLLGALLAEEWSQPSTRLLLHDAGGIGFCGSLTTFSTFSVGVVDLARDGSYAIAATYVVASLAATITAVVAGAAGLRHLRPATSPVEQRP